MCFRPARANVALPARQSKQCWCKSPSVYTATARQDTASWGLSSRAVHLPCPQKAIDVRADLCMARRAKPVPYQRPRELSNHGARALHVMSKWVAVALTMHPSR